MNSRNHERGLSYLDAEDRQFFSEPVTTTNQNKNHVTFGGEL